MSKFRHIDIKKEETSIKRRSKKIKEELPSDYVETLSLMEKLGIKMINNDNLLKSINLRKSTEIQIDKNKTSFNEEEKQNKTIKSSSLRKRKKNTIINKKEYMSSSYEKRIIKKDQIKKEEPGTNKIIKIKKYNDKKEVSKKIKKDKDKDINILNISAKKRMGTNNNNNNDLSNKQKIIKKLKSNEKNENKKVNFKKSKAEKFINITKDNSASKKIQEFKSSLKPKSDKKENEIYFTDIKNDDEELAKEIEDVFNNNNQNNKNNKSKNKKIKHKSNSVQKDLGTNKLNINITLKLNKRSSKKINSNSPKSETEESFYSEKSEKDETPKNHKANHHKRLSTEIPYNILMTENNEESKKTNNSYFNKRISESAEAKRSNKRRATEMMSQIDLNVINNRNSVKKESLKNLNQLNNNNITNFNIYKRRSLANPLAREKFENLLNQITLRQNGGNTQYLKNYETGEVLTSTIELKIKNKNIFKNIKICSCTKPGCSGPGIVKTNQDSFFIKNKFLNDDNKFFLGVCDGHGEKGHIISQYVSEKLPEYIKNINYDSITNEFKKINNEIYDNKNIESKMSGTTVSSLIITPEKILSINLGDSRSCLIKNENGLYSYKYLSRDHKPSEKDESLRIINNNGRIKRCYDEDLKKYLGPERVWLKNKEEPGLAMTRSIGDKIAHSIGVIDEPEFKNNEFDGNEKFIIIASDGIWEYLNGDDCIKIVKKYYEENYEVDKASFALVKEAFDKWKRKEIVIDDITVIVIFFCD